MEFVLLLAIFLTSSGYLFKAAMPPVPPTVHAPAVETTTPATTDSICENRATVPE
ncbi:hypothetical protein [Caballeronia sp. ATUFL_M1_KS5A]|uniref:hypothetical protein n=1 Tax=Caballeronia sp. ATUFL_M1_KS5A TaxID=2921778 RepID=UPI002028E28A|nr:hypothetical protein [Caballeronia sp. ATUFL_M1_KS5A]